LRETFVKTKKSTMFYENIMQKLDFFNYLPLYGIYKIVYDLKFERAFDFLLDFVLINSLLRW